jgi:hypothetical protein
MNRRAAELEAFVKRRLPQAQAEHLRLRGTPEIGRHNQVWKIHSISVATTRTSLEITLLQLISGLPRRSCDAPPVKARLGQLAAYLALRKNRDFQSFVGSIRASKAFTSVTLGNSQSSRRKGQTG